MMKQGIADNPDELYHVKTVKPAILMLILRRTVLKSSLRSEMLESKREGPSVMLIVLSLIPIKF